MVHANNPDQSELLEGPTTADIATFDKVLEIEREIMIRRKVYPRWIKTAKLGRAQADKRLLIMEAILVDYKMLLAIETAGDRPLPKTESGEKNEG